MRVRPLAAFAGRPLSSGPPASLDPVPLTAGRR